MKRNIVRDTTDITAGRSC